MIHVCLASHPPDGVGGALAKLAEYQQEVNKHADYSIRVKEADSAWTNKKGSKPMQCLREMLESMCSDCIRCMFCEDSRGNAVEHFRPKSLYPEYVFDWANFLYACSECNGPGWKGSKFSVYTPDGFVTDVTRKKGADKIPPLPGEPLLINPRIDNPLEFLYLDLDTGILKELAKNKATLEHKRAKYTIDLLGLNDREELPPARQAVFCASKDMLEKIAQLKAKGANVHEIEARKRSILKLGHRVVWAEMKRSWKKHRDLPQLFSAVPEALAW